MKRAVFIAVIFFALLVAPVVSYEDNDDDDGDFQNVADELDNKLQSFEEDNDNDNEQANVVASNADDDNDDDNDNDNEESPALAISSKISSDVASLEEGLDATKLSAFARAEVESNLNAIKTDAKKYAAAESASRRASLAEAMKDRMKALRMQLEEADSSNNDKAREQVSQDIRALRSSVQSSSLPAASRTRAFRVLEEMSEKVQSGASAATLRAETQKLRSILAGSQKTRSFEEEAVTAKVSTDITSLEETLDASNLPADVVSKAKANLAAIKKDTMSISTAEGSRKSDLSRAIKMRMDALKLMLEADNTVKSAHAESAVARDVNKIEGVLSQAHLSSAQQKEAMNNLEAIKRDAEEISSASPRRAKALKQALSLRMKALQRELA